MRQSLSIMELVLSSKRDLMNIILVFGVFTQFDMHQVYNSWYASSYPTVLQGEPLCGTSFLLLHLPHLRGTKRKYLRTAMENFHSIRGFMENVSICNKNVLVRFLQSLYSFSHTFCAWRVPVGCGKFTCKGSVTLTETSTEF